jgi:hypothetical protein
VRHIIGMGILEVDHGVWRADVKDMEVSIGAFELRPHCHV